MYSCIEINMSKYKVSIFIILLVCLAQSVITEVYYIGHSQLPNESDVAHHLTLPQLVFNSSNFLTNDTQLIFAPGNYSLESEILVENVHSFSMSVMPIFSSKVVIICDHNARFEFRNISIVTVSGLDFVGCFENYVLSIGHFQIEKSKFHRKAVANGTVLTIDESISTLDRVVFITTVGTNLQDGAAYVNSSEGCPTALTDRAIGVLSRRSVIVVTQSWFEGNNVGLGRVIDNYDSDIMIFNTTFVNNSAKRFCYSYNCCFTGSIVYASGLQGCTVKLYGNKFVQNVGVAIVSFGGNMLISHSSFINNSAPLEMVYGTDANKLSINKIGQILQARITKLSIRYSEFVGNNAAVSIVEACGRVTVSVDHSTFTKNTGRVLYTWDASVFITHSEFVDNTVATGYRSLINLDGDRMTLSHCQFVYNTVATGSLINLNGDMITLNLNEFINNRVYGEVVVIPYYILASELTISKNSFMDNHAESDIFINSDCKPGLSTSFGSPRCIKCPTNWLVIIVIASIVAGVAIVIFILVLNMTVAVGTLNGILFYAHIVANAETYFFAFLTPNIVTVFISWLNLDIGFDVCLFEGLNPLIKPLTQLAFPAYIILLVIIVIVASECSSKFARIIGKGNTVAVLATMILLSYAKFLNSVLGSIYLLYFRPAYGSRKVHLSSIGSSVTALNNETYNFIIYATFLIVVCILIILLGTAYIALIFFWQCFTPYQDKVLCKLVKYQKLRHFIEPYHHNIIYNAKNRYWTGLLLFICVIYLSNVSFEV